MPLKPTEPLLTDSRNACTASSFLQQVFPHQQLTLSTESEHCQYGQDVIGNSVTIFGEAVDLLTTSVGIEFQIPSSVIGSHCIEWVSSMPADTRAPASDLADADATICSTCLGERRQGKTRRIRTDCAWNQRQHRHRLRHLSVVWPLQCARLVNFVLIQPKNAIQHMYTKKQQKV